MDERNDYNIILISIFINFYLEVIRKGVMPDKKESEKSERAVNP